MSTQHDTTTESRTRGRSAAALLSLVAVAALSTGMALAAGGSPRLRTAANSKVGETIVVDSAGHTVYALTPETRSHLLCNSKACWSFWPPVTVPSRKTKLTAAKGVKGKLAILRRSDGKLQITLAGMPLYRFAPDGSTPGAAGGNGINSFGGHWHVIKASSSSATAPASTNTGPSMSTTPSYTPPGY